MVHIFREELEVVTAEFFGAVHRQVGVLHQGIHVAGVFRRHGDTNTDGGDDVLAFDTDRLRQRVQQFFCNN